ncbi:uncharacterized protein LOC127877080 isoform X2 [Dreissena polymorpha]|uniref:uncharacterized protein LOC127877080 isoform X2 n=1 Tax=Dreissena polymorpha TaxID=45954 RepID=UPI002264C816|nr:uncharacterized protein LOC127877080 isoform X2 [Dreissena polymorpha]
MDTKINEDFELIRINTRDILTLLQRQEECGGNVCRNAASLAKLKHDLEALTQRVSSAEESVQERIERKRNEKYMRQRFDEFHTQVDEMQNLLRHVQIGSVTNSKSLESTPDRDASGNNPVLETEKCTVISEAGVQIHVGGTVQTDVNVPHRNQNSYNSDNTARTTRTDLGSSSMRGNLFKPETSQQELIHQTSSDPTTVAETRTNPPGVVSPSGQATNSAMDTGTWIDLANMAMADARLRMQSLKGFHTVLLLDISESMLYGNAWAQAKTFVHEFLEGLQEHEPLYQHPGRKEHVALATFGHKTQLDVLMTTDFTAIRDTIESIQLGGPSPLYGGLMFALAGALAAQIPSDNPEHTKNLVIPNRIIVISDGRPTETSRAGGPDIADQQAQDQTFAEIVNGMHISDSRFISVFHVGVGDYDRNYLEMMTADLPCNKVFSYKDGRRLSRQNYLAMKVSSLEQALAGLGNEFGSDRTLTREDIEDVHTIQKTSLVYHARMLRSQTRDSSDKYHERFNAQLPVIGTRVVRGPDWNHGDQDKNGPGTIVGHAVDDAVVWVQWDAKPKLGWYRYGEEGFGVLISDEPRQIPPGEIIAVGCQVKPCPNAKIEGVHAWNTGVVIKVNPPKAHVRWKNGKRGDYFYGVDRKAEIELSSISNERSGLGAVEIPLSKRKSNKIKKKDTV